MSMAIPAMPSFPGEAYHEGGEPVNTQKYKQDLSRLRRPTGDQPLFLWWDINGLAAGGVMTFESEAQLPDYWVVTLRPVAGSRCSVYPGPNNSGVPLRIGGGGQLKIPALSEFITIVAEAGSAALVGTVVACRKYDVSISGGNV